MANIFTALKKGSDSDIRNQVATLEVVTITNLVGIQSKKAYNKVATATNVFGKIFLKKDILSKAQPKEIEVQIQERYEELSMRSRPDIELMLRNNLKKRVRISSVVSDEELSMLVVNKAAEHMKIGGNFPPEEKIDAVFQRYSERIRELIIKKYNNSSSIKKEEFKARINKELDSLSKEEHDQMCQALKVKELTADTVMHLLKTTGITGLMVVGGSTFGSYMLLSILLHGVFTTLMGITLPFAVYTTSSSLLSIVTGPVGWAAFAVLGFWQYKSGNSKINGELYCKLIFFARLINGRRFAPIDEEIPNWINRRDIEEEKKYKLKEQEYAEREAAYQKLNADYTELKNQQQEAEYKLQAEIRRSKSLEHDLETTLLENQNIQKTLESMSADLEQAQKDKLSAESKTKDISLLYAKIKQQAMDIETRYQQALNNEKNSSQSKIDELLAEKKRIAQEHDSLLDKLNKAKQQEQAAKRDLQLIDKKNRDLLALSNEMQTKYDIATKALENANKRKNSLRDEIENVKKEKIKISNTGDETLEAYNEAQDALLSECRERAKMDKQDLMSWFSEDKSKSYEVSDQFAMMFAMADTTFRKQLLFLIKQIISSDNPGIIAGKEGKLDNGKLSLPITGTDKNLIYQYDPAKKLVVLESFNDKKLLSKVVELERENENLRIRLQDLRQRQDEFIAQQEASSNDNNKVIYNKQVHNALKNALRNAKHEINIMSPWVSQKIIDLISDELNEAIKRGVVVKIVYGIENKNYNNRPKHNNDSNQDKDRMVEAENVLNMLHKKYGKNYFKSRFLNSHSKLIICDDNYYIITSCNPLSNKGDSWEEIGEISHNKKNIKEYRDRYFKFN